MQPKLIHNTVMQVELQDKDAKQLFIPQLVSFRELVPQITSTSYLTHSVYYYPAKFIPQVVKFCIDNYTQQND